MNRSIILISALIVTGGLVLAQTPPVPTNLSAQSIPGDRPSVLLTWSAPAGPWHFEVYRSEGDTNSFSEAGWSNFPGFVDFGVLNSHAYFYYVVSESAFVESPRSEIVHVIVNPSHPQGHVAGTVTDGNSQPIPNVRITLARVNNIQYHSAPAITNLQGHYQVDVDTGVYFVRAEPPGGSGYRSVWYVNAPDPSTATPVVLGDSSSVVANFSLPGIGPTTLATVRGVVQGGGDVLEGATVVFMRTMQEMSYLAATTGHTPGLGLEERVLPPLGYTRGVIWAELPTDEFGRYYAHLPIGGSYIAVAARNGYLPQYLSGQSDPTEADIITIRDDTSGVNFNLPPVPDVQNSVRGTIRDTTGQPVPSRVILFPKPPGTQQPPPVTTRFVHSDSMGNFELDHVYPGVYNVLAVPYSDFTASFYRRGAFGVIHWQDADSIVVSGLTSNIDIGVVSIFSPGLTRVSGTVTSPGGDPVPGSRVVVRTIDGSTVGSGLSDGSGNYSIDALPVGTLTVHGDRTGYAGVQGTVVIPPNTFLINSNVVLGGTVPTTVETGSGSRFSFELEGNYPNPFNPSTMIRYTIPERTHVVVKVFDILGKEVATLVDEVQDAGRRSVRFNASGRASGLYFYRLEAQGFVEVRKMLLLK